MGTRGHCWYQSSGSSWSPVEGKKSTLGSFIGRHKYRLKQDVQLESCKLSFIWGKMRTAAKEAASQIVLREKAEEPDIKLPTSDGSLKKQESSIKTSISALLTMLKPLTVWITINCGKF